jgi:hypothetical protein
MGHVGCVPLEQPGTTAVAADRDLLPEAGARAGRGRQAVAEPEVVAGGIGAAAHDKPRREGREGN